mmetsp:Transcript_11714/g.27833  ORF Transcript_11714/g.27833 Transcript_11714/m.27833 type:complete len:220 (+) Transcript_11714:529-1188(+)
MRGDARPQRHRAERGPLLPDGVRPDRPTGVERLFQQIGPRGPDQGPSAVRFGYLGLRLRGVETQRLVSVGDGAIEQQREHTGPWRVAADPGLRRGIVDSQRGNRRCRRFLRLRLSMGPRGILHRSGRRAVRPLRRGGVSLHRGFRWAAAVVVGCPGGHHLIGVGLRWSLAGRLLARERGQRLDPETNLRAVGPSPGGLSRTAGTLATRHRNGPRGHPSR